MLKAIPGFQETLFAKSLQVTGECDVFYAPYKLSAIKQRIKRLKKEENLCRGFLPFVVWITYYVIVTLFDMMYIVQIFVIQFVSFVKEYETQNVALLAGVANQTDTSAPRNQLYLK